MGGVATTMTSLLQFAVLAVEKKLRTRCELPTMFQGPGLGVFGAKGFYLRGLTFVPKG